MQEPYEEGVAHHLDPESCADVREGVGEALTGEHTGRAIELRNHLSGVPTLSFYGEGNTTDGDKRESPVDATESENHGMCGSSMRENRETPRPPLPNGGVGRWENAVRQTSHTHGLGESDDLIVPAKQANNADPSSATEPVEGSGSTKGNVPQAATRRTQSRKSVSIGLEGVRKAARRDKDARFTALLHHITPKLLERSYYDLKRTASPGMDGVTWKAYKVGLEDRIVALHDRVHRGTYRAQPSKRSWIPKADGRKRPLGIAALEDKIVQMATKTVLECIYENDFVGFSYGFRPKRNQHKALDALWMGMTRRKVNWVLDADIRGFFDAIDHEWMLKFVEHRIADRRVLRLIRKWLRAGVSEEGKWSRTTVGTPQGSVISPLLSNVYLHYVLDLWVDQWRTRHARGDVIIVRYADDFVIGFQHRDEAERCLRELRERFGKFGLSLHPEKTRLIEFGRFAGERRSKRGEGKPETFDFLGLTHISGKTGKGAFTIKRRSTGKRMRSKLKEIKGRLVRTMHSGESAQGRWLSMVVRGWLNYHAVPDNSQRIGQFVTQVHRHWLAVLRHRSQKGRKKWTWLRMRRLIERWLPRPRIQHPYPNQRLIIR